jgi:hypothetical protein
MNRTRLTLGFLTLMVAAAAVLAYLATTAKATTWTIATPSVTYASNSAQGGAATQTATIAAVANRMNYIEGFDITGGGATAASVIDVTITGLTNTLHYEVNILAGVTGPCNTQGGLFVRFPSPLPASTTNTAINVVCPSFGAGNTNQAATIYGFTQ